MSRYARRTDANQTAIMDALRKIPGVTVKPRHDDLLVGFTGSTFWFEVKAPDKVSKRTGKVLESAKRKSQKKLDREWTGHRKTVTTVEEIINELFPVKT